MHLYVKSVCFAHNVYFLLLYIKNVKLATIIKNVIKKLADIFEITYGSSQNTNDPYTSTPSPDKDVIKIIAKNDINPGVIGEIKHISCQYGFVATGARKDRKFNSGLGGGALLDIGIYNLGFLRIICGQDPQNVETLKVNLNEYGTDDYSCLKLTYNDGCTAESVQTIGQELKRNARIEGTKGNIFLPDFQHAETMILEVEGKEPETIECPVDINGFEYEIREASRCVKHGYCSSDVYTAKDSIALTRLMYDIRMSWS